MILEMSSDDIDRLLESELVGRIGCHSEGTTYVVPINYAYEDGRIYGHTIEGTKVRFMRANPSVCFEIDCYEGLFEWKSVIAWGSFRELSGDFAKHARDLLLQKLRRWTTVHGEAVHTILEERFLRAPYVEGRTPVTFCIDVTHRTGRFEAR